ncbi:MAG: hypothetical protein HC905_24400 [Bacteroidales bacterium]|nr:hypothetical protein [Bacteroidales bacterium]
MILLPLICSGQTTIDEIINDMILPHEGLPHGVPFTVDWSQNPRKGATEPGEGWTAAIAWGQVYEWSEGSLSSQYSHPIKDLEMYYLSKTDYKWVFIIKIPLKVSGANYVEDFAGDVNKPADIRTESDGSISTTCGDGYNFHFWPSTGRFTIPNDIAGCFVTVKARLILDDINGIDDRDKAKYLMSVGGDWWLSLTAPWDNWKTNWDIGIGRFRFITPEWKSFNMYSVPEDTMRNNPPLYTVASPTNIDMLITDYPEMEVFPVPCKGICNIEFLFRIQLMYQ